ncbi:UPF0488 protein [Operophtera brumata]|uniref:UPF0488 protein n=1 Tax=Operophtera brumata TaxID=104452 RepID=A0A0L7LK32_OPEBR|nr:UPF0488 protein [Operophtera brumata]
MPKATKLHAKGKTTTIQKPCKAEKDGPDGVDPEEKTRQFQLELCWCVQQLERSLNERKGNEKQLLKNNNQPIIRKRQLMRTHFGDYRAKMAAEEKKLVKMASKIKISEVPDKPKATFFRKSAFLTTGDSSFKFNFNLPSEAVDNGNSSNSDGNTIANKSNNAVSNHSNTAVSNDSNNAVTNDSNTAVSIVSNDSNTVVFNDSNTTVINDSNTEQKINSSNVSKDKAENFKFSFTSSEFKFNFDV